MTRRLTSLLCAVFFAVASTLVAAAPAQAVVAPGMLMYRCQFDNSGYKAALDLHYLINTTTGDVEFTRFVYNADIKADRMSYSLWTPDLTWRIIFAMGASESTKNDVPKHADKQLDKKTKIDIYQNGSFLALDNGRVCYDVHPEFP